MGSMIHLHRGNLDEAQTPRRRCTPRCQESADVQERATYAASMARILLAERDPAGAIEAAMVPLGMRESMGMRQEYIKEAWVTAVEGALESGNRSAADELLAIVDTLPPGSIVAVPPGPRVSLPCPARGGRRRRAGGGAPVQALRRLVPRDDASRSTSAQRWSITASGSFGLGSDDQATPLLAEAHEIFERLEAQPVARPDRGAGRAHPVTA